MSMKKLTIKSVVFNLLFVIPIFSFAAISEQDKISFKKIYGSEIKPETYTNIYDFCDKSGINIDSCLDKLKARPSKQKSIQSQTSYRFCCVNKSNSWGEYAYIGVNSI